MISEKFFTSKRTLLLLLFLVLATFNTYAQDGKVLFSSKCATCHNVFKKGTGPALGGFQERDNGKWSDIKELTAWIKNPAAYIAKDTYTASLKAEYGSLMQASPDITEAEVTAIAAYINETFAKGPGGGTTTPAGSETQTEGSGKGAIVFGIISLIMAIIALILLQVNSNLKKLSDEAEGVLRPDPVPFFRNKAYIALFTIALFIVGGYYVTKGAIDFGRQKSYQPEQPIYYSHKVHAGINQINCLYCHGNAMESKHAAIPSTNVCMNCHKTITTYEKGPKLYDEQGKEINGTREIEKLFEYAGFDPNNPNAWDASKAKSIPWTKIHNLPDHVYFNHSQHVKAGNVQCQTCHGEITNMDEVYQFAELSMGWCVNCHRNTKVDFNNDEKNTGNKFYSIYEKFHNDIKSGKMDSVTVKDIGGIECQKCHY
ncbi:MAG TPA: c-type cytochrome [Chitinophagaceae bacterium]|nr:c-type cytochrome [Chitinophagaceae bacterium]